MLLFKELEQFDNLLKFYLKIIEKSFKENGKKSYDINENNDNSIKIDKVLSFNYTNNAKIYLDDIEKEKYYPIHFINGDLQRNHKIILGIENPDKEETESFCNNNMNLFFKNVQRVLYDIGYKYPHWLNEKYQNNVYIIGHSLAFSDKFILLDVIEHADRVTIYYYNDDDKQDKITNLYKILGDEKFSQYINNATSKPYICLKDQKEILIDDNKKSSATKF